MFIKAIRFRRDLTNRNQWLFFKKVAVVSFIMLVMPSAGQSNNNTGLLKVMVSGLKNDQAPVFVAVYKKCKPFPSDVAAVKLLKLTPESLVVKSTISDLPSGEYAVAVFQDLNNNGKLDTGLFGIPKEPYAFSNNFRPRFSAPQFSDCSFIYSGKLHEIKIELIN